MFVYSVRASSLKLAGAVIVSALAVVMLAVFIPDYSPRSDAAEVQRKISYKAKNEEEVRSFIAQFGWEVSDELLDKANVTIPSEFDPVYESYNDLQKKQGFDLTKYKKKTVTRYTYKIENYKDYNGMVIADVIVYKNKVIGGDICSADVNGFLHGFSPEVTLQ